MTQVLASCAGNVKGINSGGWGGIRVVLSPLVFQATLFLLLLLSFFNKSFSTLGIVRKSCFLSLDLRFFNLKVFHRAVWGTSFGYNDVC